MKLFSLFFLYFWIRFERLNISGDLFVLTLLRICNPYGRESEGRLFLCQQSSLEWVSSTASIFRLAVSLIGILRSSILHSSVATAPTAPRVNVIDWSEVEKSINQMPSISAEKISRIPCINLPHLSSVWKLPDVNVPILRQNEIRCKISRFKMCTAGFPRA